MEPAPELASFVERLFRHFDAFDSEAVLDALSRSPGSIVVGTAPDEWWQGPDTIAAMIRIQFQEVPAVRFEIEEIEAWKEGTVGWASARVLMAIEGMPSILTRSTVVVHEEGAFWRLVQWHMSMPVENETTLGVELTTAVDQI